MAKLIKGYYKDGVWHEYGGKLYDTIGYNTNGSMTQKAITDTLGSVMEVVSGYSMVVRVHGDASCSNLAPFYFVVDGDAFTMTITYNQPAIALNLSIIMGNTDITQDAYQDGIISIPRVTGNVVITVETASVTNTNMFTRRTTANGLQVLNNKALLKWVRGNTILWNQYRPNNISDFPKLGTFTLENVDGTIVMSEWGSISGSPTTFAFSFPVSGNTGDKILICCKAYADTDTTQSMASFGIGLTANQNNSTGSNYSDKRDKNKWIVLDRIVTYDQSSAKQCMFAIYNPTYASIKWLTSNTTVKVKDLCCVNLTSLFGKGNEPTIEKFKELFYDDFYNYSTNVILNNSMTNYVSKDGNEETLQNVSLNVPTLTGKLNGEGESVAVFPNGMKSTINLYNSELSYITKNDSAGGYFKIPYVPKGRDIKIKIKFTLTSAISSASYLPILRAYTGEAYEAYRIIRNGTSNTSYMFGCGGKASNSRVIDLSLNTVYTIEMTINSITINGKSYSLYDNVGSENTRQFELMAGYNMSLYYFQVYKADELVVDCVPYRKDMVGAIKERISDTIIYPTTGTVNCGTLAEASESSIYDEIKQDENGIWEAYKRVGDTRATNAISGRGEYDSLEQEEVYILDDQNIPAEITVADQGVEEILPVNGATPTTAPAIMEMQYGAIPSRGLLGGLLGGTKGGGSDETDYSDGEEITDYEEEQENVDEPIIEEPKEEPSDEEPKEDENEEEPKEDIKESPVIDEKQELKK